MIAHCVYFMLMLRIAENGSAEDWGGGGAYRAQDCSTHQVSCEGEGTIYNNTFITMPTKCRLKQC